MNRLIFILLCLSTWLQAQDGKNEKKGNVLTDAGDAAKLIIAKQKLLAGEYISALNAYREVSNRNPKDAGTKYYVGLCQYYLGKTGEARQTLEEAMALENPKPETHLALARIYHSEEKIDAAIQHLEKYKIAGKPEKDGPAEAELLMSYCVNAKKLMATPVNVKIQNAGQGVNSNYDDKNPCITADGRSLVFTTRRPETTNSPTDVEGDGKYFENIYIASPDSSVGEFSKASGVSRLINTDAHDAVTSISPDGSLIFIYKNDASSRASRGGNIFMSKVSNGKWRKPAPLGKNINSSYWEGGACISPDGKRLFFSSEREGGLGKSDIWMAEKISRKEWGKPINLGPEVNSPYDEAGMFLAPDGKTLFFCSNGMGSMGSYDVFRTIYENGKWTTPENLGYPVNSVAKEGQLTISADAKYAYLSSARPGGLGESDIYRVDMGAYAILEKDFTKPVKGLCILKGVIREGNEGYGLSDVEVNVQSSEGQTLSTLTNEAGEYFYTLPPGTYTLTVTRKGYEAIKEDVRLEQKERGASITEKGYLLQKK